jgi:hypothetical protein
MDCGKGMRKQEKKLSWKEMRDKNESVHCDHEGRRKVWVAAQVRGGQRSLFLHLSN